MISIIRWYEYATARPVEIIWTKLFLPNKIYLIFGGIYIVSPGCAISLNLSSMFSLFLNKLIIFRMKKILFLG